MFIILSTLFIVFLYNDNLSKIIFAKQIEKSDYYKIFTGFSAIQLTIALINNTINHLLFILIPENLLVLSIMFTFLIVMGCVYLLKFAAAKIKILECYNLDSSIYILIFNCVLQFAFNTGIFATVFSTILNGIGFTIVGLVLISILNKFKEVKFSTLTFILVLSSLMLMIV